MNTFDDSRLTSMPVKLRLSTASWLNKLARWPVTDYAAWVALGNSRMEHSVRGWLAVTALRSALSLRRPVALSRVDGHISALADLPQRRGARPSLAAHPIPQRQLDQCTPDMLCQVQAMLRAERTQRIAHVALGISALEKHGTALYVPQARARGIRHQGEVVHVHEPQGSLHVLLPTADAAVVCERGYAEPDSLSSLRLHARHTWLFLYYPRCESELEAIRRIVGVALDSACQL